MRGSMVIASLVLLIGVNGSPLDIIDDDYFDCETTIQVIYLL